MSTIVLTLRHDARPMKVPVAKILRQEFDQPPQEAVTEVTRERISRDPDLLHLGVGERDRRHGKCSSRG
jgi:hypothetical protein